MSAHGVEKRLRGGIGESARLALFQRGDHFVLLGRTELDEGLVEGLEAIGIERGEAAAVEILLVGIGAGESEVDVVEHAGIARARLARRARHQPLGECRDRCRIVIVEEGTVAFAAVMAMGGIRRLCGLGVLAMLGKRPCHHGGPGDRAGPDGCTDQERAS
jgi:hypothetical protein